MAGTGGTPPSPPTLTLFCGPPGAGKTTIAKRLEAEGRGVRLATDDWQVRLGVPHSETEFHERLQRELYRLALVLLRAGVDVILEDGLWFPAERSQKFADARASGARISWHVFDVGGEVLWQRLQRRDADAYPMSRAEVRRVLSLFVPPPTRDVPS